MGISTFSQQTVNTGFSNPVGSGNAVINGAFDIWQRGTSGFAGTSYNYGADRWLMVRSGFAAGMTVSRLPAELTGFQYCLRLQRTFGNTGTGDINIFQAFESTNSIPFAGKTVTLSFYARAGANYSVSGSTMSSFIHRGTGTDQGASSMSYSWTNGVGVAQTNVISTTWTRYTQTLALPSNTTQLGVAFTTGNHVGTAGNADFVEITGVQLEAGSVATPFKRNAPSIQAELAACQRYYFRVSDSDFSYIAMCQLRGGSQYALGNIIALPVTMRTTPTISINNLGIEPPPGGYSTVTTLAANYSTPSNIGFFTEKSSGTWSASEPGMLVLLDSTSFVQASAEL